MNMEQKLAGISSEDVKDGVRASELNREIQKLHKEAQKNNILKRVGSASLIISLELSGNNKE